MREVAMFEADKMLVIALALMLAVIPTSYQVANGNTCELTISCTAKEARYGDMAVITGYLLQTDQYPYVVYNASVSLFINGEIFDNTTTSRIGSYVFVLEIGGNLSPINIIQTQAHVPQYGNVSSVQVTLGVGTTYRANSNSDLNVYPDIDDEIYRPHSLVVDADGTIRNKPPFNYNSWLLYGFASTVPGEPIQETFAIQGGITEEGWWEQGGRNHAAIHFSTVSGLTYDIRASNVSTIRVGNIVSPVKGAPNTPLPSVWVADTVSPLYLVESMNLAVEPRQYFIKAYTEDGSFDLEIIANGTGYPFWIAKRTENMFVASYPTWFWGAYVQFTTFTGTIKYPTVGPLRIEGAIEIDREWHAPVENAPLVRELGTYYTALGGIQSTNETMFTVWQSYAPRINLPLSQSGKLVFSTGESYSFDDFELTYGGDYLAPDWFRIRGTFGTDGSVDVNGTVLIKQNYYRNPEGTYGFCQPLVNWTGKIIRQGIDIDVSALGLGECTRIEASPPIVDEPLQEPDQYNVTPANGVTVSVNVTDIQSGVHEVVLSYTTDNGTTWENVTMNYDPTRGLYSGTIPAQPYGTWIKYKIIAIDNAGNPTIKDHAGEGYMYNVVPEFSSVWLVFTAFVILTASLVIACKKRLRPKCRKRVLT
jgi:hypothetical protein